ncbi:MAG: twitching motility protein PilT [Verrucomicrobia bacterium]|nr:twitching motility protein PilT [Verrucomicrobiota bacterium]
MNRTLLPIRLVFVLLCAVVGWLVCYTITEWDAFRLKASLFGLMLGVLVVLVDLLLKGFSLRGLSAITFGLGVGCLISFLISVSPLFSEGDRETIYLVRLGLFLVSTYLCTVIALRGKDEFNLVIPYVRFVPHEVDVPLIIVDTSALIDGRIARICHSGFAPGALIIPRFVLNELQGIADSHEPLRRARGRRGLDTLGELRRIKLLDLRIQESEAKRSEVEAKLVFLATSMKAKVITTDQNLAKLAEFHGVICINPGDLARAIQPILAVGEAVDVDLVKPGKEDGQAVGYLLDGSMVVVNEAKSAIGMRIAAEIISIMPSAGGRLIFARPIMRENV